jgi:hypothetical protein
MSLNTEEIQKQLQRLRELRQIIDNLKSLQRKSNKSDIATAIIIEPRKHRALSFVVRNVLENLTQNWNVQICHGTLNKEFVEEILEKELPEFLPRITLKNLGVENLPTPKSYSEILLSRKFTEEIPTETFLIFQTDSMINPNQKHLLDKFLDYDYVGAPWKHGGVGNGGFSLRKRSKMLAILNSVNVNPKIDHEDILFSMGSARVKPYKPLFEQAKEFSVETVYSDRFFAVHRAWKYNKDRIADLCLLCPGLETLIQLQD